MAVRKIILRIQLWTDGNITELLTEGTTIQERMHSTAKALDISKISQKFKHLMQEGNVNGALKLLSDNMQNGILPLNNETLMLLKEKHPEPKNVSEDVMFQGPLQRIHPIAYNAIDEAMVLQAAINTKGGSGPSGIDADGWRRILASSQFGTASSDLRKAFAEVIKKLCIDEVSVNADATTSIDSFIASRLIPLDKNPGLRPIGVGEVLRRIAGKVVMKIAKNDVLKATGSLQVCAGHKSGAEAAIHAMHDIFKDEETEAVLLIDAENAFNSINRTVMLRNISWSCPILSTYINNCYCSPANLFIIGGSKIMSKEGTTQGDPTAMAAYALGITPLLHFFHEFISSKIHITKEVGFADDFTAAGKISEIKEYWDLLQHTGPKYGYFPKASKSHLIVKDQYELKAIETFAGSNVNLTTSGQRHLGAVIGSESFKKDYVNNLVSDWRKQLEKLSLIAEMEPQSAYAAFVFGFKSKLTYFIRTIPDMNDLLIPLEETIRSRFIPALTGGYQCSDLERKLLSLPARFGGLGMTNFES